MLGNPKYNYDEEVVFEVDGHTLVGKITVIDRFGTFRDDSDVSYDIMAEGSPHFNGQPCLYKHINERLVKKL